jgi:hypothetical protein
MISRIFLGRLCIQLVRFPEPTLHFVTVVQGVTKSYMESIRTELMAGTMRMFKPETTLFQEVSDVLHVLPRAAPAESAVLRQVRESGGSECPVTGCGGARGQSCADAGHALDRVFGASSLARRRGSAGRQNGALDR